MNTIGVLASGVRGASGGSAYVYSRGTTTDAAVYGDFAGRKRLYGFYRLDGHGAVTLYTNELVDVFVYAEDGTLIREFTDGNMDRLVEVDSTSFTGNDYTTSAEAAGNPTTLERVLAKVTTSFGGTDFKLAGGVTIQQAFAGFTGMFFSVRDDAYGATGDGVVYDTYAIQKAINAAAVNGGVVFFEPGTYRTKGWLYLPGNVSLRGSGSQSTTIRVDNTGLAYSLQTGVISITGAGTYGDHVIEGLAIEGTEANSDISYVTGLILTSDSSRYYDSTGVKLTIRDCRIGSSTCLGSGLWVGANTGKVSVTVENCDFVSGGTAESDASLFGRCITSICSASDRIRVNRCRFIAPVSCGNNIALVSGLCIFMKACNFDCGALTAGTVDAFEARINSTLSGYWTRNSIEGCYFSPPVAAGIVTAWGRANFASGLDWFYESGNVADSSSSFWLTESSIGGTAAFGTRMYYAHRGSAVYQDAQYTQPASANIDYNMGDSGRSIVVDVGLLPVGGADALLRPSNSPVVGVYPLGARQVVHGFGAPLAMGFIDGPASFGEPGDMNSATGSYYYALPGIDPKVGTKYWAFTLRMMRRPSNLYSSWLCTALGGTFEGKYVIGALNRTSY